MPVTGWDVGGVNTKVARVTDGKLLSALSQPFEIQRDPAALAPLLASLARQVGASPDDAHAVTMTAELSQMFRTKRDGVAFVLDSVAAAFPNADVHICTVDGRFLSPSDARREPLVVAASNWAATARVVAIDHPNAILIDIGTTTTDIIPIVDGQVVAHGSTDLERLVTSELVYTGALRTPAEAIVHHVPLGEATARVSAECFALVGDVHLWRGDLSPTDYSVPTPDGRPATREFAGERIARILCADREMLDHDAISRIGDAIADAQIDQVTQALRGVRYRYRGFGTVLRTAVVTGLGSFIATRAAHRAGLDVVPLAESLGASGARCAPAAAVALLLDRELGSHRTLVIPSEAAEGRAVVCPEERKRRREESPKPALRSVSDEGSRPRAAMPNVRSDSIDIVVKVGGSLLAHPESLRDSLAIIVGAARNARIAVVPGGGPFADAVRAADRAVTLPDDTAHWMAILGMDQYAHLLVSRRPEFQLASSADEVAAIIASARVPVIAPYRWLRDVDPLPPTWDVTSDSISAWIAEELRAERLVLIKPPGAGGRSLVDRYFPNAIPRDMGWAAVPADRPDDLRAKLQLHAHR